MKPWLMTALLGLTWLLGIARGQEYKPTFDLKVAGRPHSSAMDWFAQRGFNTWCFDMEGYGRSDKKRDIKQATMQQLLTGKTRLPGFSGDGGAKLGDFFELNLNKTYLNDTDLVTFIRMEDVSESGRIIN